MNDWYLFFLFIVALIIFILMDYAVKRNRRERDEWKEKHNLPW